MSVGYTLVNATKREKISFIHISAATALEIAGNPAATAVVVWYLLHHPEDQIAFVSDTYDDWPFAGTKSELSLFVDKTDEMVEELIANAILRDEDYLYQDPDEPDTVYIRNLKNIWFDMR